MVDTVDHGLLWQVIFVPDSPTASLFFSLALAAPLPASGAWGSLFQQFIEALAVVTSVKYGIWAVAIIFAGQAQGCAGMAGLDARCFTYGHGGGSVIVRTIVSLSLDSAHRGHRMDTVE